MSSKRLSREFAMRETGLWEDGKRSAARVAIIVAVGCALTGVLLSGAARGQDVEAVLKGKITELEAENKALRLLLGQIQTVLGKTPPAVKSEMQRNAKFRLFVSPGDWGSSSLVDVSQPDWRSRLIWGRQLLLRCWLRMMEQDRSRCTEEVRIMNILSG